MHQAKHPITQTLGARLMAIQAELLAERTATDTEGWQQGFDALMHGPDAQLLSSIWNRSQRREFQEYMAHVRDGIESHCH